MDPAQVGGLHSIHALFLGLSHWNSFRSTTKPARDQTRVKLDPELDRKALTARQLVFE